MEAPELGGRSVGEECHRHRGRPDAEGETENAGDEAQGRALEQDDPAEVGRRGSHARGDGERPLLAACGDREGGARQHHDDVRGEEPAGDEHDEHRPQGAVVCSGPPAPRLVREDRRLLDHRPRVGDHTVFVQLLDLRPAERQVGEIPAGVARESGARRQEERGGRIGEDRRVQGSDDGVAAVAVGDDDLVTDRDPEPLECGRGSP